MSSELVIVYHRQPYEEVEENGKTVLRENTSPNGIVPTLKSFFGKVDHGAWVAWKLAEDANNPGWDRHIEVEDSFGKYSVSRLALSGKQVHEFYHVTSKEAFWPILHSFKDRYNYDPVDWPNFREVNWRFAEAAAAEAAQGALVWVHDYNLWLVPGYLRQIRPDVKIAFFHHTPFPAPDMFNVLPWRKEIIESLMACDSVGFHIPRYATNFAAVVQSLMDVEIAERAKVPDNLVAEGTALTERQVPAVLSGPNGKVRLTVAPVGVDVDYIQNLAREEATQTSAQNILRDLGDRKLILSVGRTDYTKGGIEQLQSFERILEDRPELRGAVQLMHVSVSANRGMASYGEIQSAIEEAAGRINGRFGSLDWQPITLVSRAVPFKDLVAYYRAASAAWITPLADGMNLVAKEFIASRVDGDGVLVLSEFAGAAVELEAAVATNPFSNRSMDVAICQALDMSEPERRDRMAAMQRAVRNYDLSRWGQSVEDLLPQHRKSAA